MAPFVNLHVLCSVVNQAGLLAEGAAGRGSDEEEATSPGPAGTGGWGPASARAALPPKWLGSVPAQARAPGGEEAWLPPSWSGRVCVYPAECPARCKRSVNVCLALRPPFQTADLFLSDQGKEEPKVTAGPIRPLSVLLQGLGVHWVSLRPSPEAPPPPRPRSIPGST